MTAARVVLAAVPALCASLTLAASADLQATAAAAGSAPPPAAELQVVVADWRAAALGRAAEGLLCWVSGPGGDLRLDVLAPAPDPAEPAPDAPGGRREALLWRRGRGWTLVAGGGADAGLLEPWGREWRPAPAGLAGLARAVATAAPGSPRRLVLAEAPTAEPGAPTAGAAGLRPALVQRGRGGGGPGERVTVARTAGGPVRVRSSRRPGVLEVRPLASLTVAADPAAVYAPWWPLGEVLPRLPEWLPRTGTPGADGR